MTVGAWSIKFIPKFRDMLESSCDRSDSNKIINV